ncbi:xanthine dehydrogenase family protein molybdopterin-binding subunit [Saccharopolyspora sp. 7B]|uniref:xanthine dehydrogenase family protein molybdopterin-binding subunit n=1 Tax=Saccharopolyspora sp. 7B TaxID=2877240 RepID=UPI001CD2C250|nr:xanthine dehydrogenase family protein molybdopterin-binding subunit [Saccharopolyspora sp. 7B]MCA1283107.1 xanthine dehydrogenase family protein molybdopterin-binding subunit [Saccharopolyspora sp. 7B]
MTTVDPRLSATGTTTAPADTGTAGSARTRLEGRAKVTGEARYAGDHPIEDLAHGSLVLSTIARGRIRSIDDAAVLDMPGVLTVLHHGNAPRLNPEAGIFGPDAGLQLLQDDRVQYVGHPVALVVAKTPEQARAAADALRVAYEEEPHDAEFRADHPAEYAPQGAGTVNKGDVDAEADAAAAVVEHTYTTPEEHHTAMEPHASMARWEDGRLEIVDANQGSYLVAQVVATLFDLDPAAVRIRSEHVGGGFGSKALGPQLVLAVMAATRLRRPVRVVLTRPQVFAITSLRSATEQRVRLAADADGRLRAVDHESRSFTSTVKEFVELGTELTGVMYASEAIRTRTGVVPLNVPSPGWMRAPGAAPGSFALESAMDELAQRLDVDPVELRLRNEPTVGPASGKPFSSRRLVDCLEQGASRFGWWQRDPRPGVRRDGRWLLGTGVAAGSFGAGPMPSTAAITAEGDGTYEVRIAAADIGTGARTALAQVAAEALDVRLEAVRILIADSDFGPAFIAGGSRGTESWSFAIIEAARALQKKLAAGESAPVTARADTTELIGAREQLERHSFSSQFAEVAVDVTSGEVRVRRLLGMFAVGRIINPLTARSQFAGGMIMGLSMALHEEGVRDSSGRQANANLAGYHIAAHADIPEIDVDWVDDPDPGNPSGVKGIGEVGIVGTAAAIANAVWHATGVRHRELPISLDRVLEAAG